MIFPTECKYIGSAATKPHGDRVYFLTKYLIHPIPEGYEILEVEHQGDFGYLRQVKSVKRLVGPEDIVLWEGEITPHDRVGLIKKAMSTGKRCTIFGAKDEHITFVLDPDLSGIETVHVYDIKPPRPNLSATINNLEGLGFFGQQNVMFEHHVRDITGIPADVYPCKAGGFDKTLDRDNISGSERVACCLTGRQICKECYGENFVFEEICPLSMVAEEPFIARCCRADRCGSGIWNEKFGTVVHWGASPRTMLNALDSMLEEWRKQKDECHG